MKKFFKDLFTNSEQSTNNNNNTQHVVYPHQYTTQYMVQNQNYQYILPQQSLSNHSRHLNNPCNAGPQNIAGYIISLPPQVYR